VSNSLFFRKGTFFDVLKMCFYPFNSHFCKLNRKIVLTELTAYNNHHIDKNYKKDIKIWLLIKT
jgi:hypothetical protein